MRAENAWGTRIESGGEDPRQDLTFGYWHFHPEVDGGQPFGVARAQSLHCLRPARSFYARVNASLWGPGRANRPPGVLWGRRGREGKGRGDITESGRVGFYSPRARHIVYPKNTLRAHAIAWHAALSNGRREYLSPTSPTSLGPGLSISAIAIEARWVRRACRWTCAWIMHIAAAVVNFDGRIETSARFRRVFVYFGLFRWRREPRKRNFGGQNVIL